MIWRNKDADGHAEKRNIKRSRKSASARITSYDMQALGKKRRVEKERRKKDTLTSD
jgi:hypothetical protein